MGEPGFKATGHLSTEPQPWSSTLLPDPSELTLASLRGPVPLFLGGRDAGILILKGPYSDFSRNNVTTLKGPREILAGKIM